MNNNIPLNQWISGRYIMAEDGATISVVGGTLMTPDGTLAFYDVTSARAAADLYIAGRRREWEAKWLVGGWKRMSESWTLIKIDTPYSIHVRDSRVVVCRGVDEYDHPTLSAAIEAVNSGRYEKPDQKPCPTHLAVGQVWRRGNVTRLVDFTYDPMFECFGMTIGDNFRILNYAGTKYVGKVVIE